MSCALGSSRDRERLATRTPPQPPSQASGEFRLQRLGKLRIHANNAVRETPPSLAIACEGGRGGVLTRQLGKSCPRARSPRDLRMSPMVSLRGGPGGVLPRQREQSCPFVRPGGS